MALSNVSYCLWEGFLSTNDTVIDPPVVIESDPFWIPTDKAGRAIIWLTNQDGSSSTEIEICGMSMSEDFEKKLTTITLNPGQTQAYRIADPYLKCKLKATGLPVVHAMCEIGK